MFEVLVWLYHTYDQLSACPERPELMQELSAEGFDASEIREALAWIQLLEQNRDALFFCDMSDEQIRSRLYAEAEWRVLGEKALLFIHSLFESGIISAKQREIIIVSAMMFNDRMPMAFDNFKVLVLIHLWTEGSSLDFAESDMIFFNQQKDFSGSH